jgi:hypothetical protein
MTYFALVKNGIVENVIVADKKFINNLDNSAQYIETWINGGKRKNYAGIGYSFDKSKNAFIPPKPYNSWVLDESCLWKSPVPYPNDNKAYDWLEDSQEWKLIESSL